MNHSSTHTIFTPEEEDPNAIPRNFNGKTATSTCYNLTDGATVSVCRESAVTVGTRGRWCITIKGL